MYVQYLKVARGRAIGEVVFMDRGGVRDMLIRQGIVELVEKQKYDSNSQANDSAAKLESGDAEASEAPGETPAGPRRVRRRAEKTGKNRPKRG